MTSIGDAIKSEPISAQTLAVVVTFVAAKFAIQLDTATALAIATVVYVVGAWAARRLSTPVVKADAKIDQAYETVPGQGPKPTL